MSLLKTFFENPDTPPYRAPEVETAVETENESDDEDEKAIRTTRLAWCCARHLPRCRHFDKCLGRESMPCSSVISCKTTWVAGRVHQLWLMMPLLHAMSVPVADIQAMLVQPPESSSANMLWCSLAAKHVDGKKSINAYLDQLSNDDLVRETPVPHLDPQIVAILDPAWRDMCATYFAEVGSLQDASCMCPATGILARHATTLAGMLLSHQCSEWSTCWVKCIHLLPKPNTLFHKRKFGPTKPRDQPTPWYARFEAGSGYSLLSWSLSNNSARDCSELLVEVRRGLLNDDVETTDVTKVLMALKIPGSRVIGGINTPLLWLGALGTTEESDVEMDSEVARRHIVGKCHPPASFFSPWVIYNVLKRVDCRYLLRILRGANDEDYSAMVLNLCTFFARACDYRRSYCVEPFFVALLDACSNIDLSEARVTPYGVIYGRISAHTTQLDFVWNARRNFTQTTTLAFELAMSLFKITDKKSKGLWLIAIRAFLEKMSPAAFLTCYGIDPFGTLFGQVCVRGDLELVELVYEAVAPLLDTPNHSLVHKNAAWTADFSMQNHWLSSYIGIATAFGAPSVCCFLVAKAKERWPEEMVGFMEQVMDGAPMHTKEALERSTMAKRANV